MMTYPIRKAFARLTFASCIAAVSTAFFAAAPSSAQQPRDITYGLSSGSLGGAPAVVAKELGLFAKNGLNPRFIVLENASVASAAVVSGSVDAANSGPGELIAAQASGKNLVAITSAYLGIASTLVLAKSVADKLGVSPTAPIAARLKALDGLLIAGSSQTAVSPVALRGAAKAAGADLRMTYMAQTAMPAALESGAVQGFQSAAPFWAVSAGKGAVVWIVGPKGELPAEFLPVTSAVVQMTRAYAEANPAVVKGIVATFADLSKAIDERPSDVKAAIAKLFPDLDPKTIDLFLEFEAPAWKARALTAADMAREIEFLKTSGVSLPALANLNPASLLFP